MGHEATYTDVVPLLHEHFYDDTAAYKTIGINRDGGVKHLPKTAEEGRFCISGYRKSSPLPVWETELQNLGIIVKPGTLHISGPDGNPMDRFYVTFTTDQAPAELMEAIGNKRMEHLSVLEENLRNRKSTMLAQCSDKGISLTPYISPQALEQQKTHARKYIEARQAMANARA